MSSSHHLLSACLHIAKVAGIGDLPDDPTVGTLGRFFDRVTRAIGMQAQPTLEALVPQSSGSPRAVKPKGQYSQGFGAPVPTPREYSDHIVQWEEQDRPPSHPMAAFEPATTALPTFQPQPGVPYGAPNRMAPAPYGAHAAKKACLHIAKTAGVMGAKPQLAPKNRTFQGAGTTPQIKAKTTLTPTLQQQLKQEDNADGIIG